MHITKTLTNFFLLSIALLSISAVAADTATTTEVEAKKFYDVEIIVFKNESVPKGSELNLPTPSPSRTRQTLDLSGPGSQKRNLAKGFSRLHREELRLLDTVQQLKKSSRYKLLSHTGWRQPGLDKTETIPVWIKGGKLFGRGYSSIDQQEPSPIEQQGTLKSSRSVKQSVNDKNMNETKTGQTTDALYELEGQIIITLSRYLHTQANLVLRKPATIQNLVNRTDTLAEGVETETIEGLRLFNYSLNEKRRMRSKKLHYLDNPQFGLLVLITPYEKQEAETVDDTTLLPLETPIAIENQTTDSDSVKTQ